MPDSLTALFTILKMIVILIAVIFLANFILRLLNKQMKKQNMIMNIIERIPLNNNSSLYIVKICDEYYLVSSIEGSSILRELDSEKVEKALEAKKSVATSDMDLKSFIDKWKRGKES